MVSLILAVLRAETGTCRLQERPLPARLTAVMAAAVNHHGPILPAVPAPLSPARLCQVAGCLHRSNHGGGGSFVTQYGGGTALQRGEEFEDGSERPSMGPVADNPGYASASA